MIKRLFKIWKENKEKQLNHYKEVEKLLNKILEELRNDKQTKIMEI